ncbi:MAG: hypothetical protein WD845_17180, partial [Pirellulales bacterium]
MKKRAAAGGVQMFSFLDAMICTLGALLVLLHAFARDRQTDLVKKAEAQAAQETTIDIKAERETLEWRIEQLREVRAKTEAQLADERLKLAHIEDHERRLQEKFKELQIAIAETERLSTAKDAKTVRSAAELEAARVRIVEARDALAKARENHKRAASYSVVPYEGTTATRRRPVYIECRQDAMILQPEGVEIVPEDFAGFFGSGNPLASALRGAREYYARQAPEGASQGEPYPLLLVRPDGIISYLIARTALESWGSDFGYELIGGDWELKFTPADDRLAQLLRQIIADASRRMRELAALTAQFKPQQQRVALRASATGGFVVDRELSDGVGTQPRGPDSRADSAASRWITGKSRSTADGTGTNRQQHAHGASAEAGGGGSVGGSSGNDGSSRGDGAGVGGAYALQRPNGPGGTNPYGSGTGSRTHGGRGPGDRSAGGWSSDGSGNGNSPEQGLVGGRGVAGGATGDGNAPYGSPPEGQIGGQLNSHSQGLGKAGDTPDASPMAQEGGGPGGYSETQSAGQQRSGASSASGAAQGGQATASVRAQQAAGSGANSDSSGGSAASASQPHGSMPHAASAANCKTKSL